MFSIVRLAAFLFFTATALGATDIGYDPESNHRPQNVTDLAYWLYTWTGSYYNGTVNFRLTPREWGLDRKSEEGEMPCDRLNNHVFEFSYTSLVAIVKPDKEDLGHNPVMLIVNSWPYDSIDLWPKGGNTNPFPSQVNDDIFHLESIEAKQRGYDRGIKDPRWNLSATHLSDTSYSLFGTSNAGTEGLQFNISRCDGASDTWWGGNILRTGGSGWVDPVHVVDPVLTGRFDNQIASWTLKGMFKLNVDRPFDETLGGDIVVDFLGRIDAARSDELLSGAQPDWKPIVGFSRSTVSGDDESNGFMTETMSFRGNVLGAMLLALALYL